jgi:hypothetical protein
MSITISKSNNNINVKKGHKLSISALFALFIFYLSVFFAVKKYTLIRPSDKKERVVNIYLYQNLFNLCESVAKKDSTAISKNNFNFKKT